MIKKIYLSVITLITIGCAIYGASRMFGGVSVGYKAAAVEESVLLDKYTQLNIDMDVSDINITKGTEYRLDYSGTDNFEFSYRLDNGVLQIEQKQKIVSSNSSTELTLTVPQEALFTVANITSNVGDVIIEEMNIDTYTLDTDVGDTLIYGSRIKNIELESNTGDLTVIECEFGIADIQCGVGEVKIERCDFENLDIKSEVGDVFIESENSLEGYAFVIKTNIGTVEINDKDMGKKYNITGGNNKLKVTGDVGDIFVKY